MRHNPKTRRIRASTAARAIYQIGYDYPGIGEVLDVYRVGPNEFDVTTTNPRPMRRNTEVRAFLSSLERGDLTIMRAPLPERLHGMVRSKWISAKPYGHGGLEVKITKRGRDFLARIREDEDRAAARAQTHLFNPHRNPGCGCGGMRRNPGGCGCGGMRQNPADDRHYVVETRGKSTKRHGPYPSRSLAESKARKLAAGGGTLAVVPATRTNGARRNSLRRTTLESMIYAFDRI